MLKIYGVPVSVHTRKVILAALEKNLAYEIEPVIPFTPPSGWDRLSPTGKIPVIEIGDLTLQDSSVICAYLERVHPSPALYPSAPRHYARALWFEEYADGTLFREVVHGLFFQKVIRPKMLGKKPDAEATERIRTVALPKAFRYLDGSIEGEFLAGGCFGIADIAVISNLVNFHYLGYQIDASAFPRLAAYFRSQLKRPSIEKALKDAAPAASAMGLDTAFVDYLGLAAV
jgi:glutathione S-transferase